MPDIFVSDKKKEIEKIKRPVRSDTASKKSPVIEEDSSKPMFSLASFAVDPIGVSFANQGENEQIHLFLRRHFITNIPWIVLSILLFFLPPFVFPLLEGVLPLPPSIKPTYTLILVLFYYIVVFGGVVLASFINWYFNVYIVTNERIVDVDFIHILYREVSSTRLNLIQDVTVKTGGVIRAVFNYGDILIQTAGTEVNFDFHAVPRPQEVARGIDKLMRKARKEEGISELEEAIER